MCSYQFLSVFIGMNAEGRSSAQCKKKRKLHSSSDRDCSVMVDSAAASHRAEPESQTVPFLQLVSLQKAAGFWELNAALTEVFGKTEDEVTNQKPAQVDRSVWATVLALIWLYAYKFDQRVEWQFVAMKAASWIRSQKPDGLSQCVCDGNVLLGSQSVIMVKCCGLVSEKNVPVPLKSISVQLQIRDHVASVSSSLQYVNEEERPLEAVFVFPLPADAAVCHFSARIGEQEIVAEVQDRRSARDQYDDAVSSGQQVFLLEESDESPDVFRLNVGCLSPGQTAVISIVYVIELSVQADNALRFCLPAVLNPRYKPAGSLMGDPALMISLYPEFPADVTSSLASQGEFIFVVDRSQSMRRRMHHGKGAQRRIESARDTLLLLLKSLPMGCYFNIYGFGSRFESFFPQSVVYSEETMEEALRRVKNMNADIRGTKILQPLKHIYSQPCYPDHPRQLFVFTDGEVWNTKEVLDLVKSHVHSHRCFSFGIGEGASTALVTGMAREGSGHAQFITGTDSMQPKVMQSLRFALQPAADNISVDWTVPEGVTVDMLSAPINALFQGQRALIYAQIKGQSSGETEGAVTVKYKLKDQPVTNQLQFTLKPTEDTGLTIHRLAARTVIRSLELQERAGRAAGVENIRNRIVELSVQAGVSSVHTAFIAVNKDSKQTVKGPLLQRRVPLQPEPESRMDPFLQLVSLQKAAGFWELNAALTEVFGKTEDEVTNQKPAQVDGSVWATVLALIWLYAYKFDQRVEWQFVAMKAASWIRSQKPDGLSQCVCDGNVLLGSQVTEDALGI
ncbi:von Willebrand factor A domain-containing 5A-like protein [Labeo rohita]|uniref:von Willebrand factor A domain-containing 5A-like protein n=1 Tax=Labeo rohita TaxID=84645 RepID=A0A498MDM8_LABRO|nr:von Willebrand factor A domain-containing 5A-like protein [Labeo rohita]